jgi:hypothetical protein
MCLAKLVNFITKRRKEMDKTHEGKEANKKKVLKNSFSQDGKEFP